MSKRCSAEHIPHYATLHIYIDRHFTFFSVKSVVIALTDPRRPDRHGSGWQHMPDFGAQHRQYAKLPEFSRYRHVPPHARNIKR